MALGIITESVAVFQKSKSKKINPSRFCDTGLYKKIEYVKKTPIIIPLIPLYSVAKHKWLVG